MSFSKDHYINLRNGVFSTTSKADLDQLFQSLASSQNSDKLVIYFHGGLVNQQMGLSDSKRLWKYYSNLDAYLVFFVWESGLLEVLSHNLREIFDERIFQQLLTRVTQFAIAKLNRKEGERGGRLEVPDQFSIQDELHQPKNGNEPFADKDPAVLPQDEHLQEAEAEQFRETLEMDYVIEEESQAIAKGLKSPEEVKVEHTATRGARTQGSRHTLMSPSVLDEIRREVPDSDTRSAMTTTVIIKGAISVLTRVIGRFAKRRDHGVYATAIEEILREFYLANVGKSIWDLMKQDTLDSFREDPAQHGGTAFLEGLKAHYASGKNPRLVLVGHSAGAIYICHFLKYANSCLPANVTFDIVFLAPACNIELFAETTQYYKHRIRNIRVFGMSDSVEKADCLVPLVYPHSLLYFVSGVLEDEPDTPLVGMERYYSGEIPYDSLTLRLSLEYLLTQTQQPIWAKINRGDGLSSSAKSHGIFPADIPTLESLRYIISSGF